MPTKQQDELPRDQKKQERQQLNAAIGRRVINMLGQPANLYRVQVQPLWDEHYRVNIVVGVDAACAKVAHSYFLVADGEGNITGSTPPITKQY